MMLMGQIHYAGHWKGWALEMDLPASRSLRPMPYKQQVH
jgi:hypothetical protein